MSDVLDAHALVGYFEKQSGYEHTQALLAHAASAGTLLLLTAVNWGEVYYVTARSHGLAAAETIDRILSTLPLEVVPIDIPLARQAALYKASHKMSYADCFAAALAKQRKATLVTGDREFKAIEGDIKIHWL